MKCINKIPGYNKRIKAPPMQFDIDRGIEESPKMTEKEMKVEYDVVDSSTGGTLGTYYDKGDAMEAAFKQGGHIAPRYEAKEEEFDLSASRKTQIPSTISTYRKVADEHFSDVPPNEVLDFGAGLGIGTREFGFDSYEPFPQRGMETYDWLPTYTDPSQINKEYQGLISNAVLNVIPNVNGERDAAVRAIGKSLALGGKAFVSVRNPGFMKTLKNPKPYSDGVITSSGTFQKGFTRGELIKYLSKILGPGFKIEPTKLGDVAVIITKIKNKGLEMNVE